MTDTQTKVLTPPHSKESEMMVLGCMLTNIGALNVAADALDDTDFYFTEHKIIFQTLKTAYKNDKPADIHLICEELKRLDKLKAVGGVGYVTTLAQYAGTSAYIEEYTDLVKSKSILRRMINAAQEVEKQAIEDPEDVSFALDEAQQKFFAISQVANPNNGILLKDLLSGVKAASRIPYLKELQERQEKYSNRDPNDPGVTGIPTHFIDFDKLLNGLNPSNLMILAARPAMGKTALALNIAENICFKNGLPVGIFSLEMTADQLLHRMICSQSEVESDKIKTGALQGMDYQRIVSTVSAMQKHTMIIDDQPGLKITDLRARARRMKEAHNIAFLVIDYLQLLSGSGYNRNTENRQNEISEISRMLKNLARELNIPVLCLSQLSRKVEERQGHRPMMSDLRESGCLAGDTLITDAATGKRWTIKALAERAVQTPLSVEAVDPVTWKIGTYPMVKVFHSGVKKIYKLKTRTGRTVKASANHPFLRAEGWKNLEDLKVGDAIALPRAINILQGAGPLSKEELVQAAQEGRLLDALFEHSNEDIALFLKYFWHKVGTINLKSVTIAIHCTKTSPLVADKLQHLLLRLKIQSSIKKQPGKHNESPTYRVEIKHADSQCEFLKVIGAIGEPEEEVAAAIEHLEAVHSDARDSVLSGNTSYSGAAVLTTRSMRSLLMEYYKLFKNAPAEALSASDVYWDQIMEITPLHEEDVYDATVEGVHNFIANDILVHNSIEQDADIVMFLLRREYYDPYDKPGLAELIVAKNRHGGVANINLTYRKELAQFANYSPMMTSSTTPDNEDAFASFSPKN